MTTYYCVIYKVVRKQTIYLIHRLTVVVRKSVIRDKLCLPVLFFFFSSINSRTGVTSDHHQETLEVFEDTKRLIENLKSKTDRHHNGQKKKDERTSND